MSKYLIKSYVDNNGKEPIKEWLDSLDGTTRKRILLRFDRLRDGNFGDYRVCGKTRVFPANSGERFQVRLRAIPHLA